MRLAPLQSRGLASLIAAGSPALLSLLAVFVSTAFPRNAFAAELFRLRCIVESSARYPGAYDVTVLLDNCEYPAGSVPTPVLGVDAFTFGLAVGPEFEILAPRFGSAVHHALQGVPPFFESIEMVHGGLTVALVTSVNHVRPIAPGEGQPIFYMRLQPWAATSPAASPIPGGASPTPSGTATPATSATAGTSGSTSPLSPGHTTPGPVTVRFVADLGDPLVPISVVSGMEALLPAVLHGQGPVSRGSAGGATLAASSGASGGGGPGAPAMPPAGPSDTGRHPLTATTAGGFPEPIVNPCELPLPPFPTKVDISVVGVAPAGCPAPCVPGSSNLYGSIGAALAYWETLPNNQSDPFVIAVCPGVYQENLIIDLYQARPLWLISTAGPDCTIIDGGGNGPCITILNSAQGAYATCVLGFGNSADQSAWRGFTLRNGFAPKGGGLVIRDHGHVVRILGNKIGDATLPNRAEQSGGGIYVSGGASTQIAFNDIHSNQVLGATASAEPFRGAGVAIESGTLPIAHALWFLEGNLVRGNTFLSAPGLAEQLRQGGGVSGVIDFTGNDGLLNLCGNRIFGNTAIQGMGVYIRTRASFGPFKSFLSGNEIHENAPWLPAAPVTLAESYRGGGICIDSQTRSYVAVLHNEIRENSVVAGNAASGGPHILGSTGPAEAGGGIYAESLFAEYYPTTGLGVIGNFINQNTALNEGAGAYLGLFDMDTNIVTEARIYNNTIVGNSLLGASPQGSGIYLPANPPVTTVPVPGAAFDATGNIIRENTPDDRQWYAEPPLPATSLPFRYSHMPMDNVGSANLFGPNCETANPMVIASSNLHLQQLSPCIDRGDPGLSALNLILPTDLDGDPRFIDVAGVGVTILDRGADEFLPEPEFIRGDVDASGGAINIADGINLLSYLFTSGPPLSCMDAGDYSDDGAVNLVDAIALLSYVYGMIPPVVPAPYPLCGVDPTTDNLGCLGATACP